MYFRLCVQALFTEEFLVFGCPLVVFYQDAESNEIQFWLSAICHMFFFLYYCVTVLVLKGKKVAFKPSTIRTSVSSSPTVLENEWDGKKTVVWAGKAKKKDSKCERTARDDGKRLPVTEKCCRNCSFSKSWPTAVTDIAAAVVIATKACLQRDSSHGKTITRDSWDTFIYAQP